MCPRFFSQRCASGPRRESAKEEQNFVERPRFHTVRTTSFKQHYGPWLSWPCPYYPPGRPPPESLSQHQVWQPVREPPHPLSQGVEAAPAYRRRMTAGVHQRADPSCHLRHLYPGQRCQRHPSLLLLVLERSVLAFHAIRSHVVPYLSSRNLSWKKSEPVEETPKWAAQRQLPTLSHLAQLPPPSGHA